MTKAYSTSARTFYHLLTLSLTKTAQKRKENIQVPDTSQIQNGTMPTDEICHGNPMQKFIHLKIHQCF